MTVTVMKAAEFLALSNRSCLASRNKFINIQHKLCANFVLWWYSVFITLWPTHATPFHKFCRYPTVLGKTKRYIFQNNCTWIVLVLNFATFSHSQPLEKLPVQILRPKAVIENHDIWIGSILKGGLCFWYEWETGTLSF